MNKIFATTVAVILATTLFLSLALSMIVTLFPSKNDLQGSSGGYEYEGLQKFNATAKIKGNKVQITLEDKKTGAKIEGLEFEIDGKAGSFTSYIQMPDLSGDREKMAWQYLLRNGWTKEGAAGLMANIYHESGFNPVIIENTTRRDKGYGLCQWTFGRRDKIEEWLKDRGIDPYKDSDELFLAQLEYAITEPGYEGIVEDMKNADSVTDASKLWCTEWERPSDKYARAVHRAATGKDFYSQYKDIEAYDYTPVGGHVDAGAGNVSLKAFTGSYDIPGWNEGSGRRYGRGRDKSAMEITGYLGGVSLSIALWGLPVTVVKENSKYWDDVQQWEHEDAVKAGEIVIKGIAALGAKEMAEKWVAWCLETIEKSKTSAPWKGGYELTAWYGCRCWYVGGVSTWHSGIDIGMPIGVPLYAVHTGTVTSAGGEGGYGIVVVIQTHEDVETDVRTVRYAHLNEAYVSAGENVESGAPIGESGDTGHSRGPHLHFEVNEGATDPLKTKIPFNISSYIDPLEDTKCEECDWGKCSDCGGM